ncbi:MAG: CRISPR-associated endoribonuclease Cas6 [Actinobacteria bacterium]|nr:CRISPR-associated endoribonuclease Cas6 [Actinomycetota bacterium]
MQGFIYNNIDSKIAEFLHEKGFKDGSRSFKLFSFSRINGNVDVVEVRGERFLFVKHNFSFILSSPFEEFIESFAMNLAKNNKKMYLGENEVSIYSVDVFFEPKFSESINIKMLSPITVYSTLTDSLGNKKTYYYNPWEKEFGELINSNLVKKINAFWNFLDNKRGFKLENTCNGQGQGISIKPVEVRKNDEKIINYKGTVIKAWFGTYLLQGDSVLLKMAYDCGLGSKNSQGFGLFEVSSC